MRKRTDQNQNAGDNSTNLQGGNVVIHQGISYADAKEIALDVFKSNYLELSAKAYDLAKSRAEELVDDFLARMESENSEIGSLEDPGFQHTLFNAQKEYAKTGDREIGDILVDILVDRANENSRSLRQIVLDESITIISKLTIEQLNALSLIFLLRHSQNMGIVDHEKLVGCIAEFLMPFTENVSKEISTYQHLQYCGCGSVTTFGERQLGSIMSTTYRALLDMMR